MAGDRGKRDEIQTVVFEHWFKRTRIAAAQELKEAAGDLEALDVSNPSKSKHVAFECGQTASARAAAIIEAHTGTPETPRRMEHVEVRNVLAEIRHGQTMKRPARFHHGHV